jgi:ElaB/YqjD/DUF883 family membrane-anchored ribosome-binding protein
MSSLIEPSVEELRKESERSREALATTASELRTRMGDTATELKTIISPAHIKRKFQDSVHERRDSLVKSLQRKARENPLQVAAVGAAAAYPAWALLRAIPTPLLLIGAGLFLTSGRGQQSAKEIKAKVDEVVQQGSERLADTAGSIKSDLEDRIAGARYGAEEIRDTVTSAASTIAEKTRATFSDTADAVKAKVGDVVSKTAVTAESSAALAENASPVKDRSSAMATGTSRMTEFLNENALLVAGIGAAVGAFLAASIPASEAENRLFGAGSEKLKDKAREAAAKGIEQAGDIVAEAAGSVAAAAAREGLDAAGVKHALNTVADSVRAVADRGVDTALGAAPTAGSDSHSPRGTQQ